MLAVDASMGCPFRFFREQTGISPASEYKKPPLQLRHCKAVAESKPGERIVWFPAVAVAGGVGMLVIPPWLFK